MKTPILAYPSVQLWFKKAIHSERGADDAVRRLSKFFETVNVEPSAIMEEWRTVRYEYREREMFLDKWSEQIEAYYYNLDDDYAPLTRRSTITPVISWFTHSKIPIEPDIHEPIYVKYHNRDVNREEIRAILDHASIRDRTFFLMMLECGARPYTLVQLRYKHIKEDFEKGTIPMKIDLPAELLKDRVGHRFTFIGEDGYNILRQYLRSRLPMKDDDFIFTPERKGRMKGEFLTPETFGNAFSRIVLELGLDKPIEGGKPKPLRLYCLRKYFRNEIRVSDIGYRKFWMGRSLGTDSHYITRDPEKHREEYRNAYPNIRIYTPNIPQSIQELRSFYESKLETLKPLLNFVQSFRDAEELRIFLNQSPRSDREILEMVQKGIETSPLTEQQIERLLLKLLDESKAVREVLKRHYDMKNKA